MHTRPLQRLALLALCALLTILAGCSERVGEDDENPPQRDTPKSQVFMIVFDPTVFEPGQQGELNRWLDKFEDFYQKGIPPDSRVALFIVGEGMAQATAEEKIFPFRDRVRAAREHAEELETHGKELRRHLLGAWEKAHAEEQVNKPTSCILSSLYAVQRYLDRFAGSEQDYDFNLVLLSDMIESCKDWGEHISLERGAAELGKLAEIQSEIDLTRLSRATVIQLPSRFGMTPVENQQIHSFWRALLEKKGVPKERLSYLTDFPVVALDPGTAER